MWGNVLTFIAINLFLKEPICEWIDKERKNYY